MGASNMGSALDGFATPIALGVLGLWLLLSWMWWPLFFIGILLMALVAGAIWWVGDDI